MNKPKYDGTRRRIVDRINESHREIEIYFNSVSHWNDSVRKPEEAVIDADPDGQMKRIRDGYAETLRLESAHKMPREQWLAEIRRIAIEKYEFTEAGASKTDWQEYAYQHYLERLPEQALLEDLAAA